MSENLFEENLFEKVPLQDFSSTRSTEPMSLPKRSAVDPMIESSVARLRIGRDRRFLRIGCRSQKRTNIAEK